MYRSTGQIRSLIESRVLGQPEAVDVAVGCINRIQCDLTSEGKPLDTMLLMGPTGVGKTELALTLADEFFNGKYERLDMSDYTESTSVGEFVERITNLEIEGGIVLFDEIEKAYGNIHKLFLQILDTARLRSADGKTVRYDRFLVIGTSNVASREIAKNNYSDYHTMKRYVMEEASNFFSPEVMGRWRKKVIFRPLEDKVQRMICSGKVEEEMDFIRKKTELDPRPSDTLNDYFNQRGINRIYGARPLKEMIESELRDAVAQRLSDTESTSGTLWVGAKDSKIKIASNPDEFGGTSFGKVSDLLE